METKEYQGLDADTLRKLQLTQLEIFKIIDSVCRKHGVLYSLYGGTLLGAVRHHGFIPWDDDLDIAMTRENYNRFRDVWKQESINGYFFQEYENDPEFTRTFGKIRKEGTVFLGHDEVGKNYHHGVFVDIFPFDKVKTSKLSIIKSEVYGCLYLLFTHGDAPSANGCLIKIISRFLLWLVPRKNYYHICMRLKKKLTKGIGNEDFFYLKYSDFKTMRWRFNKQMFDEYTELKFEDVDAMVIKCYDTYLCRAYGDYLKLPPKEAQHGSHIIVKLEID